MYALFRVRQDRLLAFRHDDIRHGNRDRAARGELEAQRLDVIQHGGRGRDAVRAVAVIDDAAQFLLVHHLVDFQLEHVVHGFARAHAHILRDRLIENHAADRGLHDLFVFFALERALEADVALGLQRELAGVVCHERLVEIGEILALALCARTDQREVIAAQNHVLRGRNDGLAVLRL